MSHHTLNAFWSHLLPYEIIHLCTVFPRARGVIFSNFSWLADYHNRFDVSSVYPSEPDYNTLRSVFEVFRPLQVIAKLDFWSPSNFLRSFNSIDFNHLELHVNICQRVESTKISARVLRIVQTETTSTETLNSLLHSIRAVSQLEIIGGRIDATCITRLAHPFFDRLLFEDVIFSDLAVDMLCCWLDHQTWLQQLEFRAYKNWDHTHDNFHSFFMSKILKCITGITALRHLELTLGSPSINLETLTKLKHLHTLRLNIDINIDPVEFASIKSVMYRINLPRVIIGFFNSGPDSPSTSNRKRFLQNDFYSLNWDFEFIELN